jgi:hypothetical protein
MNTQRETPDFVCRKLLGKLPITDRVRILEPSIGEGKIIRYLFDHFHLKGVTVIGSELNKERLQTAKINLAEFIEGESLTRNRDDNKVVLFQEDFLKGKETINATVHYDIVVACPPFKNNVDLEHIKLMYELLRHKGMMSTLTSPYWLTNNEPHQVEFRKWLEGKDYQLEMLPDNTFIEKDKTVPTAILTIYKRTK